MLQMQLNRESHCHLTWHHCFFALSNAMKNFTVLSIYHCLLAIHNLSYHTNKHYKQHSTIYYQHNASESVKHNYFIQYVNSPKTLGKICTFLSTISTDLWLNGRTLTATFTEAIVTHYIVNSFNFILKLHLTTQIRHHKASWHFYFDWQLTNDVAIRKNVSCQKVSCQFGKKYHLGNYLNNNQFI